MAEFTAVYLNPPAKTCSRGLLQAFTVTDPVVDAYTHTDYVVTWTIGNVTALIVMKPEFYAWNSGLWPLGDVIDVGNCVIFSYGVPVDGGAFFYWDWLPGRANMALCSSIFFPVSESLTFELPSAPSDYWLELPPL